MATGYSLPNRRYLNSKTESPSLLVMLKATRQITRVNQFVG
jgi:hypothetical protein